MRRRRPSGRRAEHSVIGYSQRVETYTVATPGVISGGRAPVLPPTGGTGVSQQRRPSGLVDTRGVGGYVVAAGSVRRVAGEVRKYQVVRDVPVAPLPEWLSEALAAPAATGGSRRVHRAGGARHDRQWHRSRPHPSAGDHRVRLSRSWCSSTLNSWLLAGSVTPGLCIEIIIPLCEPLGWIRAWLGMNGGCS